MEITAALPFPLMLLAVMHLTSPSVNEGNPMRYEGNPMRCGYVIAPYALLAIFFRARVGNMSFCYKVP